MEYQVRRKRGRQVWSGDPDRLYWILDSSTTTEGDFSRFERSSAPGKFVQVWRRQDGSLTLKYHDGERTCEVTDVDILAVHRALLECLQGGADWAPILDATGETFGSHGVSSPVDYERTGLSIATAMLDASKRRKWLNLAAGVPPSVNWGPHMITTGDVWRDLPATGTAIITVPTQASQEHGFAISAPGGTVTVGSEAGEELTLWPTPTNGEFEVRYTSPQRLLRLCNVYRVSGPTWSRVDRWTENAGLWVEPGSERTRTYHCNHASTRPPTFADLVVTVSVISDAPADVGA